ncbi:MAG: hypothetical protein ACPH12_07365 [Flavobacteriaceae bacterium]
MNEIKEKIENEIDFINQVQTILLNQLTRYAKENRKSVSNVFEEKASELIKRMIYQELDYLTENESDYYRMYLMDEDFD